MREDDDTEIRYFMPLVRRLVILAAVIVAVPVVMWTITGFVRTYVGPVRAPIIQTMMAAPAATAPDQTATIPADNPPAPVDPKAAQLSPMPSMPPMNATADAPPGSQIGAGPGATAAASAPPAGPVTTPPAAAGPGKMAMSNPTTTPPPANPAPNGIWPAPAPMFPTASATPIAPVADALPQSEPLAGPVPLPRKRPRSFVVAQAGIPVPRAGPAAPAAAATPGTAYTVTPVAAEAPAGSSSPFAWLVHLFQPSSPAAANGPQEDLSGAH